MNKKGQTDTAILFSMFIFQAFVLLMLGFLPPNIVTTTQNNTYNATVNLPSVLPDLSFSQTVLTNIDALGWANFLIFVPLEVALIYIIAKLIRGGG